VPIQAPEHTSKSRVVLGITTWAYVCPSRHQNSTGDNPITRTESDQAGCGILAEASFRLVFNCSNAPTATASIEAVLVSAL
jgi:hypothetical protein